MRRRLVRLGFNSEQRSKVVLKHGRASDKWDGKVAALQVTDFKEGTVELRCLMSARSGGQTFDLRCEVREKLIDFLQKEYPEALPHSRQISFTDDGNPGDAPGSRGATRKRGTRRSR